MITYLGNVYPAELRAEITCDFLLLSSGELVDTESISIPSLSLFLHRVSFNEHLRNSPRRNGASERIPLTLDLHYLLTVWGETALQEQILLAWAMRELYQNPVLDRSRLTADADWGLGDAIQIIPAELSVEEMMRIWDALAPPYRLSVSYVARAVQIDAEPLPEALPVVARRASFTDREAEP